MRTISMEYQTIFNLKEIISDNRCQFRFFFSLLHFKTFSVSFFVFQICVLCKYFLFLHYFCCSFHLFFSIVVRRFCFRCIEKYLTKIYIIFKSLKEQLLLIFQRSYVSSLTQIYFFFSASSLVCFCHFSLFTSISVYTTMAFS